MVALPSLLLQQLRREVAHRAASALTASSSRLAGAAAAAACDAAQPSASSPALHRLGRWALSSGSSSGGAYRGVATSARAQQPAAAAEAAAAAAEAAAAAPRPPAPYPGWRPPAPPPPALPADHLQARLRGFRPPAHALGRRLPHGGRRGKGKGGALVARYPFPLRYFEPKRVFLYDLEGRALAVRELPGDVFNVPVRVDILHRVVRWQRARVQQGTHKAKTRAEVSGGGKKPWQQKGSGRARQGSIRAPQWRGGGRAHGPVPRSHAHRLPKKVRRLGLRCALSAKAHEGNLLLVDSLRPSEPRTKLLAAALDKLLAGRPRRSAALIDSAKAGADGGAALRRAGRNLPGVEVVPACGANVYSILRRDVLVLTAAAADALAERLRAPINRLGAAGRAHAARMALARARRAREAAAGEAAAAGGGAGAQ